MKRIASLLACLFALLISPVRAADVQISFDFFHDNLSPYGDWVEVGGYGYVWHPSDVDEDWAPYTDGYWSYTDAGWTWVSYEDWGGICYHYGRWVQLDDFGWCWVPDYEWGPAWVSWRKNDDYIGWAPLPPEARWDEGHGFGVWVDVNYDIGPNYYRFCRVRDFGAPVIRSVCLPWRRNVVIFGGTVNITNITYNRDYGCVFNGGFDYDYIAPRCERPLPALRLVRNTTNVFISGNRGNIFINSPRGNALVVGAPRRAERNFNVPSRAPVVKRTFAKPAISRGWAGLDKDGTRDRLLVKMRDEVRDKTPQNAPARGFRREAVSVLPAKVDLTAKVPALSKVPVNRKPAEKPIADADTLSKPDQPNRPAGNLPGTPGTDANADGKPDRTPGVAGQPGAPGRQPGSNGENRPGRRPGVTGGETKGPDAPAQPAVETQPGLRPAVTPKDQPVAGTEEPKNKPGSLLLKPVRDVDGDGKPDRRRPGNQAEVPGTEVKPAIAPRPDNGNNDNESAAAARKEAARQKQQADNAAAMEAARQAAAAREQAAEQRRQNAERERAEALSRQQKVIEERNRAREAGENQRRQAGENEAAQRNAEAAKRQAEAARAQENARQNAAEAQRREAAQRATEARRQQTEAIQRQRSAEAAQERAANAQRQEQAEAARQRAAEAQRQQATEANRARAEAQQRLAEARRQQQAATAAQARAANGNGNARRQPESRPAQDDSDRKKKKN